MFYVELKPDLNMKKIYEIKTLFQCRIKLEKTPHPKNAKFHKALTVNVTDILKASAVAKRDVKCTGDHAKSNCLRKGRSNNVKCVLCGGNHLANYKGCAIYKDLQKTHYSTPWKKINQGMQANIPSETL
ncbi:nucleic-acid-binding protein from transposon x-element [Lasius niger]|uniref:Nucleic-acid-binding protein from transposon x-element n=1 Tax=Lasius niger TaxID=67767 RepID=A0A0J7K0G2_LASNI|nr:nucleic-acid-binding protein from transposon x-element [Lasius niger]